MYKLVKRVFDLIGALIALIVTSPLWLIIAVGIKLSSPGPVFYISMRSGLNHKEFPVYKFRSMHVYKPEDPNSGKKAEGGYVANENRIFPLGRFLRKSKIDELPQLLSVLAGRMSVVGPRPYPEKTVQKYYTGAYECVMTVKPGLAGLDSLYDYAHGELFVKDNKVYAETVLPVRTELSRLYVEKASVGLDLHCILRTIKLMIEIVLLKKKSFPYTRYESEAIDRAFAGNSGSAPALVAEAGKEFPGLKRLATVDGVDFYVFVPHLGQWYYKNWPGYAEDKEKHTRSHWLRMLLEWLEGSYRIYYYALDHELVGYSLVARGGRRLVGTTKRDIVIGPSYVLKARRGHGLNSIAKRFILNEAGISFDNAYAYIKKTNAASLKSAEKTGSEIIGQADIKGYFRRLYPVREGRFYVVRYERNARVGETL